MKVITKILILLMIVAAFPTISKAQSFEQGNIIFSAGYGFPNLGKSLFKIYEDETGYDVGGIGPLHGKFEYAVSDNIGVGLTFNFVSYDVNWTDSDGGTTYNYTYDVTGWRVNARLNFHFLNSDNVDPYFGLGIGYGNTTWSFTTNDPFFGGGAISSPIGIGFETTVGLRYYFTEMIGLYGELGLAKSLIQGGLVVKI